MKPMDTSTRIQNAAEKGLLKRGAPKNTFQKIAFETGVDSAAVNYHFSANEYLISADFVRLMSPLTESHLRMLSEARRRADQNRPPLETIARRYVEPLAEFSRKHPICRRILARFYSSEEVLARFKSLTFEMTRSVLMRFIDAIFLAHPGLDRQSARMRLGLMRTASSALLQNGWLIEDIRINLWLTASP